MPRREVRWERMFPDELEAAFADRPLAWFAYGLCEPHGPQNAVGLDALKAHAIACAAAREHGGIVAPPDYWHIHEISGYASWAHKNVGEVERTWLTAVPPWRHFNNVLYQIRAAECAGFHAAILITGHYGPNWQDLKTVLEWVQPHVGVRLYGLPDFEANQPGFDGGGRGTGDHAGKVETSLLWALEPECVDVSRIPPVDAPGPHFAMGVNVRESNRLVGERMVADEVRWLGEKADELMAAFAQLEAPARMLTYADTERVWSEAVAPRLNTLKTMQQHWEGREPPPEGSIWRRNWEVPTL